jgi:hypothetical protein
MSDPSKSYQPAILNEAAQRFLADGPPQTVAVESSPEWLQRLSALSAQHTLTQAEAMRLALAAGLAFLAAEHALPDVHLHEGQPGHRDEVQRDSQ